MSWTRLIFEYILATKGTVHPTTKVTCFASFVQFIDLYFYILLVSQFLRYQTPLRMWSFVAFEFYICKTSSWKIFIFDFWMRF